MKEECMDKDKLLSLLERVAVKSETDAEPIYDDNYVSTLTERYRLFLNKHSFHEGQVVKWKEGLRNRRLPKENQPAIVYEIFSEPLTQTEKDAGTPYFREPLDIALGVLGNEGELLIFHYDSRRFEPYKT